MENELDPKDINLRKAVLKDIPEFKIYQNEHSYETLKRMEVCLQLIIARTNTLLAMERWWTQHQQASLSSPSSSSSSSSSSSKPFVGMPSTPFTCMTCEMNQPCSKHPENSCQCTIVTGTSKQGLCQSCGKPKVKEDDYAI